MFRLHPAHCCVTQRLFLHFKQTETGLKLQDETTVAALHSLPLPSPMFLGIPLSYYVAVMAVHINLCVVN